jgi:hypothetical protein
LPNGPSYRAHPRLYPSRRSRQCSGTTGVAGRADLWPATSLPTIHGMAARIAAVLQPTSTEQQQDDHPRGGQTDDDQCEQQQLVSWPYHDYAAGVSSEAACYSRPAAINTTITNAVIRPTMASRPTAAIASSHGWLGGRLMTHRSPWAPFSSWRLVERLVDCLALLAQGRAGAVLGGEGGCTSCTKIPVCFL